MRPASVARNGQQHLRPLIFLHEQYIASAGDWVSRYCTLDEHWVSEYKGTVCTCQLYSVVSCMTKTSVNAHCNADEHRHSAAEKQPANLHTVGLVMCSLVITYHTLQPDTVPYLSSRCCSCLVWVPQMFIKTRLGCMPSPLTT